MPHAALWVVQRNGVIRAVSSHFGFNAARGFVGGAAIRILMQSFIEEVVSMPHAALWVVQRPSSIPKTHSSAVSMPHAALWVVQRCIISLRMSRW